MEIKTNRERKIASAYEDANSLDAQIEAKFKSIDEQLPAPMLETPESPEAEQGASFYSGKKKEVSDLDTQIESIFGPVEEAERKKKEQAAAVGPGAGQMEAMGDFLNPKAIVPAVKSAGAGLMKGIEDLGNGVKFLADEAENYFASKGLGDGSWIGGDKISFGNLSSPEAEGGKYDSGNFLVYSAARYLTPFGLLNKGLKAAGMAGKVLDATSIVGGGAISGLAHDPDDVEINKLTGSSPQFAPLLVDMIINPEGDSKMERRVKAGLESMAVDVAFLGTAKGMAKYINNKKLAKEAAKKADEIKKAASNTDTKIAQADVEKIVHGSGVETPASKQQIRDIVPETAELNAKEMKMVDKADMYYSAKKDYTELQLGYAKMASNQKEIMDALDLDTDPVVKYLLDDFKRGKISIESLDTAAQKILSNPDEVTKLLDRKPGDPINAEQYVALSKLTRGAGEDLAASIPKNLKFEDAADVLAFEDKWAKFVFHTEKMSGGNSEAARVMRASQEMYASAKTSHKKLEAITQFAKIAGKDAESKARYLKMALDSGRTIPEIGREIAKKGKEYKASDVMYSLWVNGALSSFKTFMANMVGNITATVITPIETAAAAMRPGSNVHIEEVNAMFQGKANALFEAFSTAADVFRKGEPPAGYSQKLDIRKPVFKTDSDKWWASTVNAIGMGIEFPGRALTATDTFFKIINNRARIHQYATRAVLGSGLKGAAAKVEIDKIINNPPEIFEIAAKKYADTQTFTGTGDKIFNFDMMEEGAERLAKSVPIARVFVPFIRTTTNLADYMVRRTPLAAFSPKIRADWAAGGALRFETEAKIAVGTGIMTMGALMRTGGIATGSGSKNYSGKRALQTKDRPPEDSIKLGGEWVDISKLHPIAGIFLMGADIAEIAANVDEDVDTGDLTMAAASMILERVTPDYLTGSVSDFLKGLSAVEDGKKTSDTLASGAAKIIETATPMRWVYKNLGEVTEDKRRDTAADPDMGLIMKTWTEMKNQWMNQSGFGGGLPVQKNIWGEEIEIPPGFTSSTVSAFFGNERKEDFVTKELGRLGMDNPILEAAMGSEELAMTVRMPSRTIYKEVAGKRIPYKMNAEEYSDFIGFMNQPLSSGRNMKDMVEETLKNPRFSDERKKIKVKETIERFQTRAKVLMMKKHQSIIDKWIEVGKDRRDALRSIEGEE